jgi:thiol-disulfide isomerase/thioredoxin
MKFLIPFFIVMLINACSVSNNLSDGQVDCGGLIGDRACNFSLMDQTGSDWTLHDHHGSIIILDFSAMWCGYCQKAAIIAQEIQDKYARDNVVWVTILLQNNYGQQPTLKDLNAWADEFEMSSSPVVSGNSEMIDTSAKDGYNVNTWPGLVIIDRDMKIIHELKGWNEMQVKFWLEQLTQESTRRNND